MAWASSRLSALPRRASRTGPPPSPAGRPSTSALEQAWTHAQTTCTREGNRLAKAGAFISKEQSLNDKANQKGWDTSGVLAAQKALSAVIPAARTAHENGEVTLSSHAGFDASLQVTDRTTAIAMVKALVQVLKETRNSMKVPPQGPARGSKGLREAHQPDREARLPSQCHLYPFSKEKRLAAVSLSFFCSRIKINRF